MKKYFVILSCIAISIFWLSSCGQAASQDIINPDSEYIYYYGATCPHCQELNKIAQENNLWDKISIEKLEVYNNAQNRDEFLALVKELGITDSGVPFVYDKVTGKYAVGVKPALELLTSRLGQTTQNQTGTIMQETSNGSWETVISTENNSSSWNLNTSDWEQ